MTATDTDTLLAGRFEVQRHLGSGSFGNTYACIDTQTGKEVAVKQLDISHVDDWKAIELFEREAQTLERLDHPGIPDYVDFIGAESGESAYLAQELAPGSTLEELLRARGRFNQRQCEEVATQLLQILAYLDSCRPPVVHRDIKPANILADSEDTYYLVDFGSVADVASRVSARGSTVAGTFGYMAPEQLHGEATVASDLYALGMTLIHLVTGRPPEDLPRARMAVQFRDAAPQIDDHFATFIEKLSAPATEDRFYNATEALQFLESPKAPAAPKSRPEPASTPPVQTIVTVNHTEPTPKVEHQASIRGTDFVGLARLILLFALTVVALDLLIPVLPNLLNNRWVGGVLTFGAGPLGAIATAVLFYLYLFRRGTRQGEEERTEIASGLIINSGSDESDAFVDYVFEANGYQYALRDDLAGMHVFWTEERAKQAALQFSEGMKVTVRYAPDNPRNARFRPVDDSPMAVLLADLLMGLAVVAFGVGLTCWYSYYLNSAYYRVGDGGTNIRPGARLESIFHLPATTSLGILALLGLLLVGTYLYDRFRDQIPRPIPLLCTLAVLVMALVGTGLYNPVSFFSVENRLHPMHFDRVQAKLPTLQDHQCVVRQLQQPEIAERFGHPVEIRGPFHAETWEINMDRTPTFRRVNIEYRGIIEGPEASGEFYAHIDYDRGPLNSSLLIRTTIDGQGSTVEFDGRYPC